MEKIGLGEADVVRLVLHAVEVPQAVGEGRDRVADVQVVPLEIGLEEHDEAVPHRPLHEIVDQEIGPHAGLTPKTVAKRKVMAWPAARISASISDLSLP